ncbi:MAG: allantoin racemase [Pseudonocardiales bacterium]|jgi:allantoin racemase|nr:allantoin racemase [Pseudonocardiales bacterium]
MRIANIVSPGAEYLTPAPADVAPDATSELVVIGLEIPMATDPLRLGLKDLIYVEAAVRAERLGFDAVFVNTVADYGLPLMREAVSIPVVGAGEVGFAAAAAGGRPFAIVTVWPSITQISYDRVLRDTGLAGQCRDIRYVLEEPELATLGGGRAVMDAVDRPGTEIAHRVRHSCVQAEAGGAEAIVLGCTCMAALTEWLQEAVRIPVINPLREGHQAAEAAVRAVARGERAPHTPNPDSVARLLAAVAAMTPMGASLPSNWIATDTADADCGDVCAVLPDVALA